MFEVAARASIGGRSKQDDNWSATGPDGGDLSEAAGAQETTAVSQGGLVLVADGIGGLDGGHVASEIVARALPRAYYASGADTPQDRLREAVEAAVAAVSSAQEQSPELGAMATTLVAGVIDGSGLHFANVGDSHIYRVRAGELHIINAQQAHGPEIDEEAFRSGRDEAWEHAFAQTQRDALTAAIGVHPLKEVQFGYALVEPGDVFLFATDGLDVVPIEQLRRFVSSSAGAASVGRLADGLVDAADRYGRAFWGARHDNTTVLVLRRDGPMVGSAERPTLPGDR